MSECRARLAGGDALAERPGGGTCRVGRRVEALADGFGGKAAVSRSQIWIAQAIAIVVPLGLGWWLLEASGAIAFFSDAEALRRWIGELGLIGPMVVIGLMAANIVASPLPGGPVLIAAGAAYGPFWATVYGLIGIELGALIAFTIARTFGADAVRDWFGERATRRLEGSEATLMAIVIISRLVPVISFDVVSYGMGLTPLRLWRFALANLLGILPMTVLLAMVGDGLITADATGIALAAAVMIAMALLAVAIALRLRPARTPDEGRLARVRRMLEGTER